MDPLIISILGGAVVLALFLGYKAGHRAGGERGSDLLLAAVSMYLEDKVGAEKRQEYIEGLGELMRTKPLEIQVLATVIRAKIMEKR